MSTRWEKDQFAGARTTKAPSSLSTRLDDPRERKLFATQDRKPV